MKKAKKKSTKKVVIGKRKQMPMQTGTKMSVAMGKKQY